MEKIFFLISANILRFSDILAKIGKISIWRNKIKRLFFKIENAVKFVYETSRFESRKVEMHMKTSRTTLVSCGMVKNLTCWFSDYEIKFEKISGH